MKNFKRIVCIAIVAVMIFCAPMTAFAQSESNTAAISIGGILDVFFKVFADIRYVVGGVFGANKIEKSCVGEFKVPALDKGFIPQGMCYVSTLDSFAICGYTDDGTASILNIVDKDGNAKTFRLKNIGGSDYKGHAGGCASDGKNLFITSGKYAHRLRVSDIAAAKDGDTLRFVDKFNTGTNASFAFCDDDMLWVGEFMTNDGNYTTDESHHIRISLFEKSKAWCVGFKIDDNFENSIGYKASSSDIVTPDCIVTIPNKVQGFARLPDGSFALSISYGRQLDSKLKFYPNVMKDEADRYVEINSEKVPVWHLSSKRMTRVQTMPTMMQGIDVEDGRMYLLFESCANKYSNAVRIVDEVWSFRF
ncbi:MAG: hypothetical protein IJF40_02570 [Clostridia bacterium]|nr:hypothetical protein [Clostridia bacterium]